MSVINTNITSLISQQNLSKSQSSLSTAMERLSSGMRINSAKDDAAGQAIANRMSAQVTGLATAQRNSNDGISVAQTAEGALNQINDNLQRIRELTVQAGNGTNSQDDLNSIQSEITQRLTEVNRISEQTDFNGVKVLQQDSGLKIQVGANDNEAINIGLERIDSVTLGLNTFTVAGDKEADLETLLSDFGASGVSDYTGTLVSGNGTSAADDFEVDLVSGKVTDGTNQVYVLATTGQITSAATNTDAAGIADTAQAVTFAVAFEDEDQGATATIGGVTWTRTSAGTDAGGNGTYSATIEGETVEVTISGASGNGLGSGAALAVTDGSLFMDNTTFVAATTKFTVHGTNEDAREIDLTSAGALYAGSKLDVAGDDFNVSTGGTVTASGAAAGGIADGDVVFIRNAGQVSQALISQDDAVESTRDPLEKLDAALSMVDTLRSDMGAIQNRFISAIDNLRTNETNLSAARSRIEDADYAVEVANMTRAQILQQAGTTVLAQANQIPQNVLSLLG